MRQQGLHSKQMQSPAPALASAILVQVGDCLVIQQLYWKRLRGPFGVPHALAAMNPNSLLGCININVISR